MRGGRFEQKAVGDATLRNVEALFESHSVAEIREVERRTLQEIEEKKEELRQLVGASYRDLIESADFIILMRHSCENVASNIRNMEDGFTFLKRSIALAPPAAPQTMSATGEEKKRREKLYGIGSRVKYIVDTPEKIWGCLDDHMYLEGAQRYFRAREVHLQLTEKEMHGEKKELLTHFPLLRHQWQLVQTFRQQISQRSRDRLLESELDIHQYATALAAVAVMNEYAPSQALSLFLETRRHLLRMSLWSAIAGRERPGKDARSEKIVNRSYASKLSNVEADPKHQVDANGASLVATSGAVSIATAFSEAANMIQVSLCQVGELFLEVNGDSPLFFRTVLNSPPASQLFGGIPNPVEEVQLWRLHHEKLENTMMPLTGEFISQSCLSWIHTCEEDLMSEGRTLLELVYCAKDLADVEASIRQTIDDPDALQGGMQWLRSAFGQTMDSPWQCVIALVLKGSLDLWSTLFEQIFVLRTKSIIDSSLAEISVLDTIDDFLTNVGLPSSLQLENGNIGLHCQTMGLSISKQFAQTDSSPLEVLEPFSIALWKLQNGINSYLGHEVAQIKEKVDERLRLLLEDLTVFLQSPQNPSRLKNIFTYLQETCFFHMSTIVKGLETKLVNLFADLNESTRNSGTANDFLKALENTAREGSNMQGLESTEVDAIKLSSLVEKALFLGRLCTALGYHSSYLQIALGPVFTWNEKFVTVKSLEVLPLWRGISKVGSDEKPVLESHSRWLPRTITGRALEGKDNDNVRFSKLQLALRCLSFLAHGMWISWSTDRLIRHFANDVYEDGSLFSSIPLKGWEEIVIKQQTEEGSEVEMKLPLPAMASSYVVLLLFRSCQEIYRIGGHVLDKTILQLFAQRLLGKVLDTYENFLADVKSGKKRVSENGILQLLFDLKFLGDVLSGGQQFTFESLEFLKGNVTDSMISSSLSLVMKESFKSQTTETIQKCLTNMLGRLSSELDPIDWATYEQHLWENERQSYQRSSVLFGFFVQLNRMHRNTVLKLASNTDSNTLKVSATAPRFTYLPISIPSMITKVPSNVENGKAVWKTDSQNENISTFRAADDTGFVSSVGAKPLLKSIINQVGSRFGEGTFKLGSMLNDGHVSRLKDRSAAAISTFGEILPVQAAGLFSSLTTASGKFES